MPVGYCPQGHPAARGGSPPDFYDFEKSTLIFYAVRVSCDTLCGWTKFFISATLTDEKFSKVANPG